MSELDGKPRVFYPRCRAILSVVFDNYSEDELGGEAAPLVVPVLPKSATIHRNKHNQADSWELVFSAVDLPFDPETIRAGAAQIYMFDAGRMDDSGVVLSRQNPQSAGQDPVSAVSAGLGDQRAVDAFTQDHRPLIVGQFDDDSIEMSSDGKWCSLKGQDYTQLLLRHWPPVAGTTRARRIPVGQRLDDWAKALLREIDGAHEMQIRIDADGGDCTKLPIVGASEIVGNKRGIPIQQETTYFDVFYKVCLRLGYVCFVDGLDLVISRPKNITDIATHEIKHMAWGNNVEHLSMTRHLGKEKVPRVVIKAYDDKHKEPIIVEVPDTGPKAKEGKIAKHPSTKTTAVQHIKAAVSTKGAQKAKPTKTVNIKQSDEYVVVPVYGVTDRDTLRRIGETHRTLIGRGERKLVAKTKDLVDIDGKPIVDLKNGDAVRMHWQDFNAEVFENPNRTTEDRIDWLVARGYQQSVAAVLAKAFADLAVKKDRPMRVRESTIEWDVNSGISIEMELQDFVNVTTVVA